MKRTLAGIAMFAFAVTASAQRQETVFFRDAWNVKTYPAAPRLAQSAAMVPAVVLPPAASAVPEAIESIMQWNATGGTPARNGFRRTLPDSIDVRFGGAVASKTGPVALSRGLAASTDRGTTVWSTVIEVEGADRLRLHLENVKLPEGTTLWVYGAGEAPRGFGAELIDPNGTIWAPSIHGPVAFLDVEVPAGTQASFVIREVMELIRIAAPQDAPTCLIDASCVTNSTFSKLTVAEAAIAHLEFPNATGNAVCTGGLLTDRANDGVPFLLTANHCFADQTSATGLEAYFDYRTSSCNGAPVVNTPVNGSTLLATSDTSDFTFIRLSSRPAGRSLLGWDANAASVASSGIKLYRVSHPFPESATLPMPQQYSQTVTNIGVAQCRFGTGTAARPRFIYSNGGTGGVYGGSSGSPVMLDSGFVVGQLLGSCPTGGSTATDGCDPRNSTVDGAFASTYESIQNFLENGSGVTPSVCTTSSTTLCLSGNRFAVSAVYRTSENQTGPAQAVALSGDTGYFTFFQASNVEMVVKVLNACIPVLGNKFWVFAGGLTNVNVTLTVIDTKSGTVKTYVNPQNTAFLPVQDTGAFATCP